MSTITTRVLTGDDLEAVLEDVARLRIDVFRDWPYLYDGSLDYERSYMESYRGKDHAVVVGAFDQDRLIGAATGTPLEDHAGDFAAPFAGTGLGLKDVFYCAESVLLPTYRGRGLGHAFFDAREAHARRIGFAEGDGRQAQALEAVEQGWGAGEGDPAPPYRGRCDPVRLVAHAAR